MAAESPHAQAFAEARTCSEQQGKILKESNFFTLNYLKKKFLLQVKK